jgi:RHS repeat-associated protein
MAEVHVGDENEVWMSASRSRSVLLVSMLGCVAALLVALSMGQASEAGRAVPTAKQAARAGAPIGREVPSLRTETSRTFRQADGSLTARISAGAVNYRDAGGTWKPIDTTLRPDGRGGLASTAAAAEVALPPSLDDPAKVTDGDRWVSFALQGADAAAAPTAAGSTATYAGALDGVDVTYEAQAEGVKETLTLADASAPALYRYTLEASRGLEPSLRDDGSVVFRDGDGRPRFTLPAPTVQEAGAQAPTTSHVAYRLSDDGRTLTVAVERGWLDGAHFPVKLDPTIWRSGDTECTLAGGTLATTADCNTTYLKVGHDASRNYRAALRFDNLNDDVPRMANIISARLSLTFPSQTTSGAITKVDAIGLSRKLGSTATWNTYDGTNAWTTSGGDMVTSPQSNPMTLYPSYMPDWVSWDVSQLAESWVRDPAANYGILLKANNETATNVISFGGRTYANGGPTLEITYEMHPGAERDQTTDGFAIDDRSGLAVGVSAGNLAVSSNDIQLPGVAGMDLNVSRTFNAQNLGDGSGFFGTAWTESINGSPTINHYNWLDDQRAIFANGGAIYRFDRDYAHDTSGAMAYITPPGMDADMTVDTATDVTTLTFRKTGTKWIYSAPFDDTNIRLSQIKDRHNNTITLTYRTDFPEKLDKITDTYGRDLSFSYNLASYGQLDRITDASGRHWDYAHDVTTSSGHPILTGFTNPDGKTTTYTSLTPAETDGTTWDKLKQITDARGHTIKVEYGSDGDYSQPTKITRTVDGTVTNDVIYKFNYKPAAGVGDACTATGWIGRTVETDPENHLTTYCYNQNGQVIQTFDANHRSVQKTYNASANVATFTGLAGTANPSLSTYTFDPANGNARGASTTVGTGNTQSATIKYCDDPLQPACSASTYGQAKYQPTLSTDSQGTGQSFAYNPAGDLIDVQTASGSDRQQLHYTASGEVDWSKDGNLRQTTYAYTSHFLTSVTPPAPLAAQTFTADGLSRILTATDGVGQTATMTYDGEDRIKRVDWSPSGKWMTFTFDNNGNVTQRADSSGNASTYGYDNLNRRTSEAFPSSRTNAYVYDKASNLKSVTDPDGLVSYTYDPANRLASITSPKPTSGTDTITYSYTDPAAATDPRKQTTTFPGGLKQEATSDAAGNLLAIKILNSSGTVLKSRVYTHTTSAASTSALTQSVTDEANNVTTFTHGAANRLIRAKTMNGSTAITQWDYIYDAAGNRTRRTSTVGTGTPTATSYAYNTANELCWSIAGTTPGTCTCPTTPASCNSGPVGATSYAYDANGQRTTTGTYDAQQRLTSLSGGALTYLSPGNGELVSYGTTGYQNGMMGLARQIPSSGSATDIIRQPNGAPVAQRVGTTSKQSLFSDALGSTIAMADTNTNAIARHYNYDPDGNASTLGSGATTNLLFAGGHQVGSLYHFGARYYDPATATWTQQDPINQIASLTGGNRYAYAGGNPIDYADPLGLLSISLKASVCVGLCVEAGVSVGPHGASGSVGSGVGLEAGVGGEVNSDDPKEGSSNEITATGCDVVCGSYNDKGDVGIGGVGAGASLTLSHTEGISW